MDKETQLLHILCLYFTSVLLRSVFWSLGYSELQNVFEIVMLSSVLALFFIPMLDRQFWATSN